MLRSRDRAGAEQELWALLTVYQALRMAMSPRPGPSRAPTRTGPASPPRSKPRGNRSSPRGASRPRRPGDAGRIGRAVLDGLLPARRARYSARKVKCSTSRYHVRDQGRPGLPTRIARVLVTIIAPPLDRPAARPRGRKEQPPGPRQAQPDTRRDKVTRIMASQPGRDWAGHDLAALLGIKPRNMLTQLAEWTRLGFLAKTGPGRYAWPAPASTTADAGAVTHKRTEKRLPGGQA